MLKTIETSIKERLRKVFPKFEIDSFPKNFDKYKFFSHNGCLLVRFENSSCSSQNTVTAVNANETYNFTIFAAFRYATKHFDCYDDINALKTILNGLPVLNKKLVLNKTDYETEINSDLWYSLSVSITFPMKDEYNDLSQCAIAKI